MMNTATLLPALWPAVLVIVLGVLLYPWSVLGAIRRHRPECSPSEAAELARALRPWSRRV
jgi:hypothetical protein